MYASHEPQPSRRPRVLAAFLLAATLAIPPLAAAPFGVSDDEAARIVAALEDRFEVIVLSRGYVLRPREAQDFELVEVFGEGVLVDGELVPLEELAGVLGDDARRVAGLVGGDAVERVVELERSRETERLEAERLEAEDLAEEIRRQVEELAEIDSERARGLRESIEKRVERYQRRHKHKETRVSFGSSLTIDEDESARDVVVIFGSLDVEGEVRGNAVVVGGSAEIDGEIGGDLTVVGGSVSLSEDAVVDGEVTSVGGPVYQEPGARLRRDPTEVVFAPFTDFEWSAWDWDWGEWGPWWPRWDDWGLRGLRGNGFELIGLLFQTLVLTFLVLLVLVVARHRVGRVAHRARLEPWKAGFVGFAVEVLVLPLLVVVSGILVVSIVGIPLLVVLLPLAALALLVFLFLGYAGVAQAVGGSIGRFGPYAAVLVGIFMIQVWQIFGESLDLVGGIVRVIAVFFILVGFFFKYLAWTVGLGAVVLDRFSPLPSAAIPPPPPPA